ncbi:adenylate kinase [Thraustotheca clavata]|uniref:Adenylate kinase n=1 Tax=Thraustotheca clavata TaxID=74557 RepID=A0A1W0A5T8_9STRA|nr:adenylate kinase [Thraustotheca clavata]
MAGRLRMMFLGPPGVGKGTYATRIAPKLNIPTISTGDLVRAEIKQNTELGKKIKDYSSQGKLVPDEIILTMVRQRLQQTDAQKGYILDGFPRNVSQAIEFDKIATLDTVFNFELPDWVLVEKLSGRRVCDSCGTGYNIADIKNGEYVMPPLLPKVDSTCDKCGSDKIIQRADDTLEVVKHRLQVYTDETEPLIKYYADKGILKSFHVKKGLADLPRINAMLGIQEDSKL